MGGILGTITNALTGGLAGTIADVVKMFLGNERKEEKLDHELKSQKVAAREKRKRALIRASPWPLRVLALLASFAPFFAPLWPGVSVEMTTAYVNDVINGMPPWYIRIVLLEYGFIWGGSEAKAFLADQEERRLVEKEVERDTEHAKAKQVHPR